MWVLLSKTKKIALTIWSVLLVLITGLTLLQTLTGQLSGMTGFAWMWTGIHLLPGFVVLFLSIMLDRQPARLVPQFAHRTLIGLTTLYLLLVLITLLAEPFATRGALSMWAYRQQSFGWLVPIQLILLVGYYLLFFKKKPIFQPGESDITLMAKKEAIKWGDIQDQLRKECFELIAQGKLDQALEKLQTSIDQTGIGDPEQVYLLQSQYVENRNNQRMNLVSMEEYQRTQSRIALALMELLRRQ